MGGDQVRYDGELRPGHTVAAIEYLQDHGVDPAIWKVEGLNRHEDAEKIVDTAKRDGRNADCILLGRHASHYQLDQWIRLIAPIPGWTGFAIGRSIWWDALHAHLRHQRTANEARRLIRDAYLDFARSNMDAGPEPCSTISTQGSGEPTEYGRTGMILGGRSGAGSANRRWWPMTSSRS